MKSSDKKIKVQITSDFICPWCFVAERRLMKAAKEENVNLEISYFAYELNPTMPTEGLNRKEYRSKKFGSWDKSQKLDLGTMNATAEDELTFNYEKIEMTPNTLLAHRLMWYVGKNYPQLSEALADSIFEGYFTYGLNIGDIQVLIDISIEVGIGSNEIEDFLKSDIGTEDVKNQTATAIQKGLRGVPLIKIEGVEIYGGQILSEFQKVLAESV